MIADRADRRARAAARRDRRRARARAARRGARRAASSFAPDLVVVSPGLPPRRTRCWPGRPRRACRVWGDIELAWRVRDKVVRADGSPAEWILITGTNGKTTTTQLTAAMLRRGRPARRAVRQHRHPGARRRARSAAGSTCSSSSSPATSCTGWSPASGGSRRRRASASTSPTTTSTGTAPLEAYRDAKARVYDEHPRRLRLQHRRCRRPREMVEDAEVVEGAARSGSASACPGRATSASSTASSCDRAFLEDRRNTRPRADHRRTSSRDAGLGAPHVVANILAASALARVARRRARRDPRRPGRLPARPAPHRARGRARRHHAGSTTRRPRTRTPRMRRSRAYPVGGLGRRRAAQGRRHRPTGRRPQARGSVRRS